MQSKGILAVATVSLAILVTGCAYSPIFGFPIQEGDINEGRQAFIDHQCHQCHSIAGLTLPPLAGADEPILELGGATTSVKTYAELMTSVIYPDHRISERYREQLLLRGIVPSQSPMPMPHVETMTVRQLIDLVAFLDSRYQLIEGYDSNF